MMIFDRSKLRVGMFAHIRTKSRMGGYIRFYLDKWVERICRNAQKVFGNHDALVIENPETGEFGFGEALMLKGNVFTPIELYEEKITNGDCQVRIYEAIDITIEQEVWAAKNWWTHIRGRPYNYAGFPRLIIKSLFFDWSVSKNKWKKRIGNKAAGWEWADWCTEGVASSYSDYSPPYLNLFQTKNPTPLTTEQIAGEIPMKPGKKITIRQIPDAIKLKL